jgi:hypothetical protein
MGSQKCRIVGKSQPVVIRINPVISPREAGSQAWLVLTPPPSLTPPSAPSGIDVVGVKPQGTNFCCTTETHLLAIPTDKGHEESLHCFLARCALF